ncbi:hypothetical protein ABNX05_14770 [Lysinibacillus sp. M3]|uniref:Uncharacterized protein n=1 Tax=Lysinibacillus zambalensis TaxID=3160866 RepID=A0ABV1MTS1_9BACI
MDLTSLITTIISATAALVAIIGGFLVSRVISLSNDQSFLRRKIEEINITIESKTDLVKSITKYLFEDDLKDFVTKSNMKLLIDDYSLEEIIREDDYTYLSKEELEPYFIILLEIKEEVYKIYHSDSYSMEFFEEIIEQKKIKHIERSEWYSIMLDAIISSETILGISSMPYSPIIRRTIAPTNTDYKDKKREKEQLIYEIEVLRKQELEQWRAITDQLETKWVWSGIGVLIYSSIFGILYPATLLPYDINIYNNEQTKTFLLILFGSCLLSIFIYLIFATYKLTNFKAMKK